MKPNGKIYKKKPYYQKKKEEPFDVGKWIKQNQNTERPRRGRKNSLGDYKKGKRK